MDRINMIPITSLSLIRLNEITDDDLMYIVDKDKGYKSKKVDIKSLKLLLGGSGLTKSLNPELTIVSGKDYFEWVTEFQSDTYSVIKLVELDSQLELVPSLDLRDGYIKIRIPSNGSESLESEKYALYLNAK